MSDMGDGAQQRQLQETQFILMKAIPNALVEPSRAFTSDGTRQFMQFRVTKDGKSQTFDAPFPIDVWRSPDGVAEDLIPRIRKAFPAPVVAQPPARPTITPEMAAVAKERVAKLAAIADASGNPDALDRIADTLEALAQRYRPEVSPETIEKLADWLANTYGKPGAWYGRLTEEEKIEWRDAAVRLVKIMKEG